MRNISKRGGKAISMALAATMAFAPVTALGASSHIQGHWAERTIAEWQDKGLISGYEDGTFKPKKAVTRAEFVRIMNQALALTEKGAVSFSDVAASDWFYNDVAIAMGEAYTAGFPDGTFKPNETVTRAQAAVFIKNALGLSAGNAGDFTDVASIPDWAAGAVAAMAEKGYMSGYEDGSFKANNVLTRAEAVSTLNRIMGNVVADEDDVVATDKDVVIDKDDTKLVDQTVEGNVIISDKVGDGEVYLDNVTVKGDIIVQGGGDDSIYLKDTTVNGKVILDKKDVRLQVSGETKIPTVEIKQACNVTEKDFKGEVGTISVVKAIDGKVTIAVAADKLVVDEKANLDVQKNIETVEIAEGAEGTKLAVAKDAKIATVVADAKVAISGNGSIGKLEANVSGVTVSSSTGVDKTETAEGVKPPTKPSTGGGGGGGGSSSGDNTDDVINTVAELVTAIAKGGEIALGGDISGDVVATYAGRKISKST